MANSNRTQWTEVTEGWTAEQFANAAQGLMGDPANTELIGFLTSRYLELTGN